ncbi:MAG: molybdenum cofactor biosynthesis protein B, partial [Halodesulfurarchaeum sp.]
MVDFQKRDTRRGVEDEDQEEDRDEERDEQETAEGSVEAESTTVDREAEHHHHDLESVGVAVLTVSSTRTLDDDPSGDAITEAVTANGHTVVTRELVSDSLDAVQGSVNQLVGRKDVDVVITTGGTGVSPDDVTIEAIDPLLEKDLPGFGETFRRQSADEIGPMVIATRATAGIANGVPVFSLPGSVDAVEMGVES